MTDLERARALRRRIREALHVAADILADALEAEQAPRLRAVKAPPKRRTRKAQPRTFTPATKLSDLDIARARQAAKKAGIPIP
jgi:hypothetical protein